MYKKGELYWSRIFVTQTRSSRRAPGTDSSFFLAFIIKVWNHP